MTREEADAQLAAIAGLTGKDVTDLEDCTLEDLTLLIQSAHDAAAPADRTPFANFLSVVNMVFQVDTPVATIASAFTGAFGVAGAAKSL